MFVVDSKLIRVLFDNAIKQMETDNLNYVSKEYLLELKAMILRNEQCMENRNVR